jgi:hypothetical protein
MKLIESWIQEDVSLCGSRNTSRHKQLSQRVRDVSIMREFLHVRRRRRDLPTLLDSHQFISAEGASSRTAGA